MNRMQADISQPVEAWLSKLNDAAARPTPQNIGALFLADGHWREAVAMSWELKTVSGREAIAKDLAAALKKMGARDFAIDPKRLAPRIMERAGVS
mgnify:CR=1 FL=1